MRTPSASSLIAHRPRDGLRPRYGLRIVEGEVDVPDAPRRVPHPCGYVAPRRFEKPKPSGSLPTQFNPVVAVHGGAGRGDMSPEAVPEHRHGIVEVGDCVHHPSETGDGVVEARLRKALGGLGRLRLSTVTLDHLYHHAVGHLCAVVGLLPQRVGPVEHPWRAPRAFQGGHGRVEVVDDEGEVVHSRPTSVQEASNELAAVIGSGRVGRSRMGELPRRSPRGAVSR